MRDHTPDEIIIVSWEFADGSGSQARCRNAIEADVVADGICIRCPDARVWRGDEQVQQGFIASDESAA